MGRTGGKLRYDLISHAGISHFFWWFNLDEHQH